ncbi:integrase [Clostridium botulinum]|nr:integrase [Clostridium botulinum]
MKKGIEEFIQSQHEENLNDKTISKYISDIQQLFKFVEIKEDRLLQDLSNNEMKVQLDKYIKYLEKQKYKPSTINGKIITINKYLKFLGVDHRGKYVKVQKKVYIDNVITEGEYKRLLEQCKNNLRDRAIIITLANTGLRISELLSLKVGDINNKSIFIKGKGAKYREIFLTGQLKEILNKYIKEYRKNTDKELLFTGSRGALQRQAINKMLWKYAKRGHVNKEKAHPHSLRHWFGKRLAEKGTSLDVIQTYLGHENISTTAIYTKRTKEELERNLENNFI